MSTPQVSFPSTHIAFCSCSGSLGGVIHTPRFASYRCARLKLFKAKTQLRTRPFIPHMSLLLTSSNSEEKNDNIVLHGVKSWVTQIVVGLGLCPFAEPAMKSDTIRYVICRAAHESVIRKEFADEVELLMNSSAAQISTSLIVMPEYAQNDFLRFHALTSLIEEEISEDTDLVDSVLIAAFHPDFRYDDTAECEALNYEKRAPYPIINILRTELLDEYISQGKTQNIPKHNKQVLERIGAEELSRLYRWD